MTSRNPEPPGAGSAPAWDAAVDAAERAAERCVLQAECLSKRFGGLRAVDDVSLSVREHTLHAIIGPNGAGKTTLFNMIAGSFRPTSGRIWYRGQEITGLPQHRIVRLGIARSYQITTVFAQLTVYENIRISAQAKVAQLQFWRRAEALRSVAEQADRVLELVGLADKRWQLAAALSHAEQRQLDIGIALAQQPGLLLLDEPTAGMSPIETERMRQFIGELRREVTLLLVEHKMNLVMSISDWITVLHFGRVLAEGTPEEVRNNQRVQEAYLEGSV